MIRITLIELVLVATPFVLFFLYRTIIGAKRAEHGGTLNETPYQILFFAGAAFSLVALIALRIGGEPAVAIGTLLLTLVVLIFSPVVGAVRYFVRGVLFVFGVRTDPDSNIERILDLGFEGYERLLGDDLPADLRARSFFGNSTGAGDITWTRVSDIQITGTVNGQIAVTLDLVAPATIAAGATDANTQVTMTLSQEFQNTFGDDAQTLLNLGSVQVIASAKEDGTPTSYR